MMIRNRKQETGRRSDSTDTRALNSCMVLVLILFLLLEVLARQTHADIVISDPLSERTYVRLDSSELQSSEEEEEEEWQHGYIESA